MLEGRKVKVGGGGRVQKGVEFILWLFGWEKEYFERAQFSSLGFLCFRDDSDYLCLGSSAWLSESWL